MHPDVTGFQDNKRHAGQAQLGEAYARGDRHQQDENERRIDSCEEAIPPQQTPQIGRICLHHRENEERV